MSNARDDSFTSSVSRGRSQRKGARATAAIRRMPPTRPTSAQTPLERLLCAGAIPRALRPGPSLARCEGFEVDSPEGVVGYVEGLRFESRIDEPDLLEVRGGRFGRELVLIPVEAVEEVSLEEERIVVRSVPRGLQDSNPSSELVRVFRRALHHEA